MPVRAATPRRTKTPVVLAAVVLAFAALVVPWIGHWAHARAPFQPSEMNLSLTLAVVPVSEVQNAIEGYGISGDQLRAVQPKSATQEAVVGQLSFSIPKRMPDESQMALFVIDERYGLSGAQAPEVFLDVLQRAAAAATGESESQRASGSAL